VIHSLGERLVEVEARASDRANVVGRSADAEVEIPSPEIAGAHCFLYVDQDRWVVQDAESGGGTFVNGQRLAGPVFLESGDVVRLGVGGNSPTLEVDPFQVGVKEGLEEGGAVRKESQSPPPWRAPEAPPLPPPQPVIRQPVMNSGFAVPTATGVLGEVPQTEETDAWANVPTTSHYYVPKRKRSNPTTTALVVVLSLAIAVGGGYWLYRIYEKRVEQPPVTVVKQTPREEVKPTSVFDFGPAAKARAATQAATRVTIRRMGATRPGEVSSAAEEAPPDPRMSDPEWRNIEVARLDDPVLAIVKFDDYRERFPDTPYKKDLDQYTQDALDRIWWQRLAELFEQRDSAMKEIADRKQQLAQSQDAAFKKEVEGEIAKFAEARDRADETIRNQMKFTGQSPPNPYDSQDLAINRRQRDAAYYETWKAQVLAAIRHSRGQRLPWRSSR
jgi:pSer/pThr/pTyr-binding forkhead associated (FHA) protein